MIRNSDPSRPSQGRPYVQYLSHTSGKIHDASTAHGSFRHGVMIASFTTATVTAQNPMTALVRTPPTKGRRAELPCFGRKAASSLSPAPPGPNPRIKAQQFGDKKRCRSGQIRRIPTMPIWRSKVGEQSVPARTEARPPSCRIRMEGEAPPEPLANPGTPMALPDPAICPLCVNHHSGQSVSSLAGSNPR